MLRKDIFSLVSEASNNKFVKKLTLQTNATIAFYSKTVRKLKENGLQHAFVAFHSHDEKVSNRLTSSTLWKKTVVGINHFLDEGIMVTLNPVINKLNYQGLSEYVEFVHENFSGIISISFSFVQPNGRAWKNKWIVPKYSNVSPFLSKALKTCRDKSIPYINPFCGFPMCMFPGSMEQSAEFIEGSSENIFQKKSVERVKNNKVHSPSCELCKYRKSCNGVWLNYAKIHGLSELKPVSHNKKKALATQSSPCNGNLRTVQ